MGRAKAEMLEIEERGWRVEDDKFVCADCVEDEYLKSVIENHLLSDCCSYCGRAEPFPIASSLEALMPSIADGINYYFSDPVGAGVPWDEGSPAIEPISTADALMSLPLECHDGLFQDVVAAFWNDAWVPAPEGHWLSEHEHQRLAWSWSTFVETVMHRTRFHFHLASLPEYAESGEVAPGNMLPAISACINQLDLVKQLENGVSLHRVRIRHAHDTWEPCALELGPPPESKARAGRMNPAGIPYLYLALDGATALAETITGPPVTAVLGRFVAVKPLTVIDLTDLPALPSVFDGERASERESLLFLEKFVEAITRPVAKDESEHVSYVPSQVVCEYLAQVFHPAALPGRVDGLLYRSAVRPRGKNLVLFPSGRSDRPAFSSVEFQSPEVHELQDWADVTRILGAES